MTRWNAVALGLFTAGACSWVIGLVLRALGLRHHGGHVLAEMVSIAFVVTLLASIRRPR